MSEQIYQFGTNRAQTAGFQLQSVGCGNIQRIDGYCTGANSFLQIFDKASAPSANAIPLKSLQVFGNDGFSYVFVPGQEVPYTNGVYLALSSDETKYVADGSGTKVSGDCLVEDLSGLIGTTKVGPTDISGTGGILEIWAHSAGSKTLKRISVTNAIAAGTKSWLVGLDQDASGLGTKLYFCIPLFTTDTGATVIKSISVDFDLSIGTPTHLGCIVGIVTNTNPAAGPVSSLVFDVSGVSTLITGYYI